MSVDLEPIRAAAKLFREYVQMHADKFNERPDPSYSIKGSDWTVWGTMGRVLS